MSFKRCKTLLHICKRFIYRKIRTLEFSGPGFQCSVISFFLQVCYIHRICLLVLSIQENLPHFVVYCLNTLSRCFIFKAGQWKTVLVLRMNYTIFCFIQCYNCMANLIGCFISDPTSKSNLLYASWYWHSVSWMHGARIQKCLLKKSLVKLESDLVTQSMQMRSCCTCNMYMQGLLLNEYDGLLFLEAINSDEDLDILILLKQYHNTDSLPWQILEKLTWSAVYTQLLSFVAIDWMSLTVQSFV